LSEAQGRFIILKKMKYAEADLIIHALSDSGAKKSFIARSALKSKKRFGGGILEPTHFVNLIYKESKSEGGLNTLNEATLIDDFKAIRSDYDRLEMALFFLNCVHQVSQEGDDGSHFLFNLLGHSLRGLGQTKNILRFKMHFCLKFMFQQGVLSMDDWMGIFLKVNIADSDLIDQDLNVQNSISEYLPSIESQVLQYLKTADNAGSVY
jgi:DNA repair protein RecO (recombination protein O)